MSIKLQNVSKCETQVTNSDHLEMDIVVTYGAEVRKVGVSINIQAGASCNDFVKANNIQGFCPPDKTAPKISYVVTGLQELANLGERVVQGSSSSGGTPLVRTEVVYVPNNATAGDSGASFEEAIGAALIGSVVTGLLVIAVVVVRGVRASRKTHFKVQDGSSASGA